LEQNCISFSYLEIDPIFLRERNLIFLESLARSRLKVDANNLATLIGSGISIVHDILTMLFASAESKPTRYVSSGFFFDVSIMDMGSPTPFITRLSNFVPFVLLETAITGILVLLLRDPMSTTLWFPKIMPSVMISLICSEYGDDVIIRAI
jgi:hypothetical protein